MSCVTRIIIILVPYQQFLPSWRRWSIFARCWSKLHVYCTHCSFRKWHASFWHTKVKCPFSAFISVVRARVSWPFGRVLCDSVMRTKPWVRKACNTFANLRTLKVDVFLGKLLVYLPLSHSQDLLYVVLTKLRVAWWQLVLDEILDMDTLRCVHNNFLRTSTDGCTTRRFSLGNTVGIARNSQISGPTSVSAMSRSTTSFSSLARALMPATHNITSKLWKNHDILCHTSCKGTNK